MATCPPASTTRRGVPSGQRVSELPTCETDTALWGLSWGAALSLAGRVARRSFWTARGLKRSEFRMVWGGTAGGGLSCSAAERSDATADAPASDCTVLEGAPSP